MTECRCKLEIPGFPNSGTSSFHEHPRQRSDIRMSHAKARHHFFAPAGGRETRAHTMRASHLPRAPNGVSGNRVHPTASGEKRRTGSRTPSNLRRRSCFTRHLVERALSHFLSMYRLDLKARPLREAMEAAGNRFCLDQHSSAFTHFSECGESLSPPSRRTE